MATGTFFDTLGTMRRRARLSGRPLSTQEVSGVVRGMSEEATGRLATMKAADARERELGLMEERFKFDKEVTKRQMQIADETMEAEGKANIAGSAISGAGTGMMVGGPWGAAAGAGVGILSGMMSKKGGGCIIITACTDPWSSQVNLARIYRDTSMSALELIGYYSLARAVAPWLKKKQSRCRLVKRCLVDRLVDYGEWALGYKNRMEKPKSSYVVSNGFIFLCALIGIVPSIKHRRLKDNG